VGALTAAESDDPGLHQRFEIVIVTSSTPRIGRCLSAMVAISWEREYTFFGKSFVFDHPVDDDNEYGAAQLADLSLQGVGRIRHSTVTPQHVDQSVGSDWVPPLKRQ
jgi:hypothetical protein